MGIDAKGRKAGINSSMLLIGAMLSWSPRAIAQDSTPGAKESPGPVQVWGDFILPALKLRCKTAICLFGEDGGEGTGKWFGVEPVLELPIGKTFYISGSPYLSNATDYVKQITETDSLNVGVIAGVRLWFVYDLFSVGILLLNISAKNDIQVAEGPTVKTLSGSALRTATPGLTIGVFGDVVVFNVYKYVLRNDGTAVGNVPPYGSLSGGTLASVAIAPFTLFKDLAGKNTK
jgi:hypothetical protein